MTNEITSYPLTWPEGWKRTTPHLRIRSRFGKYNRPVSIARAVDEVLDQLRMMGIRDWNVIISTDLKLRRDGLPYSTQKEPDDSGASVWWKKNDRSEQKVIALDKYDRIADNLWAIAKTIEALRGIERWGGGEILNRTFTGFTALPDPSSVQELPWRKVLDYAGHDVEEARARYRRLAAQHHPDRGGDASTFNTVRRAWEAAQQELGG